MTIEVLNVSKNYEGKPYLKNVSLDISSGSVISVVGAKKSGKTALLRIIMGLEEADDGQVNLLGDYKYDRFNIGAVFQDDRLCPGFTAGSPRGRSDPCPAPHGLHHQSLHHSFRCPSDG